MGHMEIRYLREAELAEFLTLLKAKAQFDGCPAALAATEATLQQAMFAAQPQTYALVAAGADGLRGMATFSPTYSTFLARPGLWLDDLYVASAHRGQGIGRALMRALCTIAMERGCARIDWIVARNNDDAKTFYEEMGAQLSERVQLGRLVQAGIAQLGAVRR